ncbi:AMP-binding protein [Nitrosomonas halophila]|uniref:Long-chain acyl-CoA synthetase n=1 Tax=Nitrosomonas halophila TaxID=44576 RepID=A0A1H3MIC5_9PROT|nr:AMP-binding protein [Nitrosomonas halophila]SDY76452.1 long-chain acyl-CoA synthetase [Nitrosomonas halophila]
MKSLAALLGERIAQHGSHLAIQYRPRYRTIRWRYEDMGRRIAALAAVLEEQGVGHGDRVLLFAENSPDWAAAFLAILTHGAVVVPVNPKSTGGQIERLVASANPKCLLISSHAMWPASPMPTITIQTAGKEIRDELRWPAVSENSAIAEIIYTSGTTGDPKGVMLSHENLLSDLEAVSKAIPLAPHHHVVSLVPLFHAYGQMTSLFCPFYAGCAVTYLPTPTSRTILETFAHTPVTHLVAVPEVLKTMMDRLEERIGRLPGFIRRPVGRQICRRIFGPLEAIACGGAALDPVVEEKWWSLGLEVLQGYGLTETSPILTVNTPDSHRIGSVGKPIEGAEIRISTDGEVLARGPMVMAGYYHDARRTEAAFASGWFKTDDGGRLDEDGYLYVFGRRRYMILGPSGENVFPEDIEAELNRNPAVTDSAVIGLEKEGKTIIHAVLLCDPAAGEAAIARANRNLAPHQQIMSWSVWPEPDFPRSVTRKVKKEEVMHQLAEQEGAHKVEVSAEVTPLKRLLGQVTGVPPDTMGEATLLGADLGIDSLLRIELVSRIEDQWGIAIEEVQITPQTTVGQLETLLETQQRIAPQLSKYPRWSLKPWARRLRPYAQWFFLQSWISLCCRLRVEGAEHLEGLQGPVIFMANHRSFLDSAVVTFALPKPFRWRLGIAAATDVFYQKYAWSVPIGELALNAFPFPTGVNENIRPGLEYFGRLLDDGWNVLIFPEGRQNREDLGILPLKGGTGVIAMEMQVPVIPVVVEDTEKVIPPDTVLPRAIAAVTVRFGKPMQINATDSYATTTARIEAAMQALLTAAPAASSD